MLAVGAAAYAQGSTHQKTPPPPKAMPATITAPPPAPESKWQPKVATPSGPVVADGAAVNSDGALTRLAIDLTGPVEFQVFRLTGPDRVVVDLTNLEFAMPASTGRAGKGIVRAFRFGAFAPGKSRVVIETTGPVKVEATRLLREGAKGRHRLEIDLAASRAVELSEKEVAAALESSARLQIATPQASAPSPPAQTERQLPTIVIDPGHGGVDTGAEGALGAEKDVVLAVARELNRSLLATGRYRVVMTRTGDVFVPLEQRMRISRQHGAQLFISLHADSLEQRELAGSIRGATIYTLSQSASDERARRLADKENSADVFAGLHLPSAATQDDVKSILFDLIARETNSLSASFRQSAAKRMRGRILLSRDPQRSANFLVLKQAETPAVLIELGYISHAEDEKLMHSTEWQKQVSTSITSAIDDHFAKSGSVFR
jgi:N-acetylmuramoyl-L-alanine amidase